MCGIPATFFSFLAAVDNARDSCVYWECVKEADTLCIDLAEHSKSAEKTCFASGKKVRGFHLVRGSTRTITARACFILIV